jgi:hypothetical protein
MLAQLCPLVSEIMPQNNFQNIALQVCGLKRDLCCPDGETCHQSGTRCIRFASVCGQTTCATGTVCLNEALCCPLSQVCGPGFSQFCCSPGFSCDLSRGQCCPAGGVIGSGGCCPAGSKSCGSDCCSAGNTCLNGQCCPDSQQCAGQCCAAGQICQNQQCVTPCPGQVCSGVCCQPGFPCIRGQCCPPEQICGSACCSGGLTCINNRCVAAGSTSCGPFNVCPPNTFRAAAGVCCPIGSTVCNDNQCCDGQCGPTGVCCPEGTTPCGSSCCRTSSQFCASTQFGDQQCCQIGAVVCGNQCCPTNVPHECDPIFLTCCPVGTTRPGGGCCLWNTVPCGGTCCLPGVPCPNDICCTPGIPCPGSSDDVVASDSGAFDRVSFPSELIEVS